MDSLFEGFKLDYVKYCVNATDYSQEELILCPIPKENDALDNALIRGYVLLSRWKPKDNAHMKILTTYDKLLKKNQEDGMLLNPKIFANILYILHRYCVRLLNNPWRKEFFVIKDYNGFYQYTLASHLSPSVINDLLGFLGFEYDTHSHTFNLRWESMNPEVTNYVMNAGIGFFLSYIHCRARNDANFKERVKSLTYLLQKPRIQVGDQRSLHQTTTEQIEYNNTAAKHVEELSVRENMTSLQPSPAKSKTLGRTNAIGKSAIPCSEKNPIVDSRSYPSCYPSGYDDDLYGPNSGDLYHPDHAREGTSTGRFSTMTTYPQKYGQKLDRKMHDITLRRNANDKYQTRSAPDVGDSYVKFLPMDRSTLSGRGSPDGGIDVEKVYAERRHAKSDHVYHHIK